MPALVKLAQKPGAPYARTRFNIIPTQRKEMFTPRCRSFGAYTSRGCGVTKATSNNEKVDGIHAPARLDDAMNGFEYSA
eukprot:12898665-Prorocentrum_lima.AAC.1